MMYLESALDLDIYLVSDYPECKRLTEDLFQMVCGKISIRNKDRSKETLKFVLVNLWISYKTGLPIKYSRNRSSYPSHTRYGKLHIKFKRLIPIIDAMADLGLAEQKIGFYDRDKNLGRQTRIFPTQKLIELFEERNLKEPGFLRKEQPNEIIQLKNSQKLLMDFQETQSVNEMRKDLRRYNQFIAEQEISVCAPPNEWIDLHLLHKLELAVLKGVVNFNKVEFVNSWMTNLDDINFPNATQEILNTEIERNNPIHDLILISDMHTYKDCHPINVILNSNTVYPFIMYPYTPIPCTTTNPNTLFITYTSTMTKTLRGNVERYYGSTDVFEEKSIADFGLSGLDFQSRYNYLHRVFNNGSFTEGGRFYGGFHLELPKTIRKHILIHGEPTVEPDFSALHIRMLYHLEGIDYREDPYTAVCDEEKERKVFKIVLLVAINAENEREAIFAIKKELHERAIFFDSTYASILSCLSRFKKIHQPIAKYLNTGVGLKLQNMDSQITRLILNQMTDEGIPVLPVHDSFIVREKDWHPLINVMISAYEKVMGFDPIVKMKGVMY